MINISRTQSQENPLVLDGIFIVEKDLGSETDNDSIIYLVWIFDGVEYRQIFLKVFTQEDNNIY
jgi:hypothetical protein